MSTAASSPQRAFRVRPVWDSEAGVFVSDSDIIGLHVEATTVGEFEAIVLDVAPDLVLANHRSLDDLVSRPLRDLVPTIIIEMPLAQAV